MTNACKWCEINVWGNVLLNITLLATMQLCTQRSNIAAEASMPTQWTSHGARCCNVEEQRARRIHDGRTCRTLATQLFKPAGPPRPRPGGVINVRPDWICDHFWLHLLLCPVRVQRRLTLALKTQMTLNENCLSKTDCIQYWLSIIKSAHLVS